MRLRPEEQDETDGRHHAGDDQTGRLQFQHQSADADDHQENRHHGRTQKVGEIVEPRRRGIPHQFRFDAGAGVDLADVLVVDRLGNPQVLGGAGVQDERGVLVLDRLLPRPALAGDLLQLGFGHQPGFAGLGIATPDDLQGFVEHALREDRRDAADFADLHQVFLDEFFVAGALAQVRGEVAERRLGFQSGPLVHDPFLTGEGEEDREVLGLALNVGDGLRLVFGILAKVDEVVGNLAGDRRFAALALDHEKEEVLAF